VVPSAWQAGPASVPSVMLLASLRQSALSDYDAQQQQPPPTGGSHTRTCKPSASVNAAQLSLISSTIMNSQQPATTAAASAAQFS